MRRGGCKTEEGEKEKEVSDGGGEEGGSEGKEDDQRTKEIGDRKENEDDEMDQLLRFKN